MSVDTAANAYAQAQALIDLGRAQDAIPPLARAIADDPDAPEPRCLMAVALLESGDATAAAESARSAIALDPQYDWPHRLHGLAVAALGRLKEGRDSALQAVRFSPESSANHRVLAGIEFEARRLPEARRAAERAVQLGPDEPANHEVFGAVALEQKEHQVAEMAFRRALELDPERASSHNDLGVALARQKRHDEAMRCFEMAARIDPRNDLGKRNLVRTGSTFVRRGGVLLGIATMMLLRDRHNSWTLPLAVVLVVAAAGFLIAQQLRERSFSPATRGVLDDDRARLRRRPWRWRPSDAYWPVAASIVGVFATQLGIALLALPGMVVTIGVVLVVKKVPLIGPVAIPAVVFGYAMLIIYLLRLARRRRGG